MTRTQREYFQRINRVMDYIDAHLGDPLPLETLAEVAAFSRAFRGAYGMSPSAFRIQHRNLGTMDRKASTATASPDGYDDGISQSEGGRDMPQLQMEPIPAQSVTVVEKPEMTLAYVRHTGPYFGDTALFGRLFGVLYNWAQPRNLIHPETTETIIIYHDDPSTVPEEKLRVSCCIAVPADTEVSGEIGRMTLEAGTYAEARFTVDATQFGGAWNWVYGVWLPESVYQPDDKLCYEKYPPHGAGEMPDGSPERPFIVDICVPVKPL